MPSDLLYRSNCHIDKQSAVHVGEVFFAWLWIADIRPEGEQIMLKLHNKALV